jgi:hypothetical protein
VDDAFEPYRKQPLVQSLASNQGLVLKRSPSRVPRDGLGRFVPGYSGNPFGRPRGRVSVRLAFHRFGLNALIRLNALADDPTLSPSQRAGVLAEFVRLSYSLKSIRSDASAERKLAQQHREAEMDAAVMDFFRRLDIPPAFLARAQALVGAAAVGSEAEAPACPSSSAAPGGERTPHGAEAQAPSRVAAPAAPEPPATPSKCPFRIALPA